MSSVHLPHKSTPRSALSILRQYAQLNFLEGARADWLVPVVAIGCVAYLAYFVMS